MVWLDAWTLQKAALVAEQHARAERDRKLEADRQAAELAKKAEADAKAAAAAHEAEVARKQEEEKRSQHNGEWVRV